MKESEPIFLKNAEAMEISTRETTIFLQKLGKGAPLLLLHGFPQTHFMWRDMARMLGEDFTIVCPDLRGYGYSGCPVSDNRHTSYSKRAMANDMIAIMDHLGFSQFFVAGHDRGGRVAYRMALDHSHRIKRLCVLDIIPTVEVWDRIDRRFTDFWPWSLLAQPAPLPEKLIGAAPEAVLDDALTNWGSKGDVFSHEAKEIYINQLRDPLRVHAICEEYRAGATIDYDHDDEDRKNKRRIQCPVLALWANGASDTWYKEAGGVIGIWKKWADDVNGFRIDAGHFFPEEKPAETASAFKAFFTGRP